jgi:hypothetical protein
MGRIRSIKPEFPQSESMGRISRDARLCFILLWTVVDDEGRARANSRMLASLLYPYDKDAQKKMPKWLNELATQKCIVTYEHEGQSYLQVIKWSDHQKIDRPTKSKFPPFVASSRKLVEGSTADMEGKGRDMEEEAASPAVRAATASLPFIELPTNIADESFRVNAAFVKECVELYPAVDVKQQLRSMRGWLVSNSQKRKTMSGMPRFVHKWLAKEQNSGRDPTNSGRALFGPSSKPTVILKATPITEMHR